MVPEDTDEGRAEEPDAGANGEETESGADEERTSVEVDPTEEDQRGPSPVSVEGVDQRIVDLLSWILDTETRAKIYVFLLANPGSTSDEVARGTGLYPSTVREALAELHDESRVTRDKRASEGAGNNPYEYTAIQPSDLVGGVVDQFQQELNTVFNLDRILDRGEDEELPEDVEPVTITVDDAESNASSPDGTTEDDEEEIDDAVEEEIDGDEEEIDDGDEGESDERT